MHIHIRARNILLFIFLLALILIAARTSSAESPTYTVKMLTPETALKAAQAALARCRKNDFQIAVAVVDRAGLVQVLLRDRFAGAHTPDTAINKAWTSASFRQSSALLCLHFRGRICCLA